MAIARDQSHTAREVFMTEVRNSLPRVAADDDLAGRACGASIEHSILADRWLRERGFDRWGAPASSNSHSKA